MPLSRTSTPSTFLATGEFSDVDDVVGALPQLQLEDNQVVDHESDSESGYESDGLIIQQ